MSGIFNTNGVDTTERVGGSKYLNHAINKAKINSIVVEKAKQTESRRVVFYLEGDAIADKSFEGIDGAKGRVGKMATSYMKEDKSYKDFMRQIGVIADKLGVRPSVDAISASSIEEYIAKVSPFLTGKFLWWNIAAEEWDDKKFALKLLKYDFVKALSEIDETTLVHDAYLVVEARNAAGMIVLRFNKDDKYQFTPYVKPSSNFDLPGANATAQSFVPPTFSNPEPKSLGVDDLPFPTEEEEKNPNGLPF
jgi:hypothetical protein